MSTDLRPLQPWNALLPTDVAPFGMAKELNFLQ
jgi:hypothetical protein